MTQLQDTIWALNKDQISIKEFINWINDHIQRILYQHDSLKYHIHHEGDLSIELSPTATINLYRIVQEALNNIVKHADAELIYLDIQVGSSAIEIKVVDDGIGLDNPEGKEVHYGLQNMRARMKELGGTLLIQSSKGTEPSIIMNMPWSS